MPTILLTGLSFYNRGVSHRRKVTLNTWGPSDRYKNPNLRSWTDLFVTPPPSHLLHKVDSRMMFWVGQLPKVLRDMEYPPSPTHSQRNSGGFPFGNCKLFPPKTNINRFLFVSTSFNAHRHYNQYKIRLIKFFLLEFVYFRVRP